MREEIQKQDVARELRKSQVKEPFRFFVTPGESREIVIIDDEPTFFRQEHAIKKKGQKGMMFAPCVDESTNCPLCTTSDRPSYFAMYLTVLDLTTYINRDDEEITWSKKLLVVKPSQQKKIVRLWEKEGTLRGMVLEMTRDGDKDAAIGNDINFVEFMPEEELDTYVTEYEDKEGTVHEVIGFEEFDYEAIFPEMTEKQLQAIAGVPITSSGRTSSRTTRTSARGRAAEEEQEEAPAPARGRAAARREATPTRAATRRGRDEVPVEEEEEEHAPRTSRASSRVGRSSPPPRQARAPVVDEDEEPPFDVDEPGEEEAPTRASKAVSPAARRAQLRGGRNR